jgi:hypothetical protein
VADVRDEKVTELINAIVAKLKENRAVLCRSSYGQVTWRMEKDRIEITLKPSI